MRRTARTSTIAITLVALALCADRTVAASPAAADHHRADRATLAGQIVRKLQVSFRRIVPAVEPLRERCRSISVAPTAARPAPVVVATLPPRPPVSPFESRLPPPGC